MEDEKPNDALFVALTRPALKFGIPFVFLLAGSVLVIQIFLFTRSFILMAVAAAAVYVAGKIMGRNDPFLSSIMYIKLSKCFQVRNFRFWRGNSYRI